MRWFSGRPLLLRQADEGEGCWREEGVLLLLKQILRPGLKSSIIEEMRPGLSL